MILTALTQSYTWKKKFHVVMQKAELLEIVTEVRHLKLHSTDSKWNILMEEKKNAINELEDNPTIIFKQTDKCY